MADTGPCLDHAAKFVPVIADPGEFFADIGAFARVGCKVPVSVTIPAGIVTACA
jgi:hypothetical protein